MMHTVHMQRRLEILETRLVALAPSIERARQSVMRLETEHVPAGSASGARVAQLSAARAMAATLEERERQVRSALAALHAELSEN